MPQLVRPDVRIRESFAAAAKEFLAEGRGEQDDASMLGREMRLYGERWLTPEGFASYVADLNSQVRPGPALPPGWVPCTTLWYVEGEEYLGRLAIRHTLTEWLRDYGGHIGYDVRPTARRLGHATAMLREALPVARELGVGPVLITCDVDNTGSRKVIQACGGVLEDERGGKLRFWVPVPTA